MASRHENTLPVAILAAILERFPTIIFWRKWHILSSDNCSSLNTIIISLWYSGILQLRHGSNVFHMRRIECKLAKRIVFVYVKYDVWPMPNKSELVVQSSFIWVSYEKPNSSLWWNISRAARTIWNWSLLGVKGLNAAAVILVSCEAALLLLYRIISPRPPPPWGV